MFVGAVDVVIATASYKLDMGTHTFSVLRRLPSEYHETKQISSEV